MKQGGMIRYDMKVTGITHKENGVIITCSSHVFHAHMGILAVHRNALALMKGVHQLPVLQKLRMEPLFRMYAIFPVTNGVSWFSDLDKMVTPGRIRYIIPIHPAKGIVMISYTDGNDARYWMKESNLPNKVMAEIRRLFSDRTIPDPLFFKLHPWKSGCTYWLPGEYDVEKESYASLHPLPNEIPALFLCGESFAVHQAWMESALHQADHLLAHPRFQSMIKALK
jgi:hypothetical protein